MGVRQYEGLTTEQIPSGVRAGTSGATAAPAARIPAAGARADEVLAALPADGDVLVFSHGHFSRVLTARWLGLEAAAGALFVLAPAGVGVLGHEQERRVLRSWG